MAKPKVLNLIIFFIDKVDEWVRLFPLHGRGAPDGAVARRGLYMQYRLTLFTKPLHPLPQGRNRTILAFFSLFHLIFKHFTIRHYLLGAFVKRGFEACMYGCVGHDVGNRVTVPCLNRCIRLFATAYTFHPVTHVV